MVIEPVINMHKIKYEELNKIVEQNFNEGKFINIFINLNSILYPFYSSQLMTSALRDLEDNNVLTLSSEIINLISHYRHYFWRYYKVPSIFYIYYNDGTIPIKNKKYCINYMKTQSIQRDKNNPEYGQINKLINDNIKLIKLIIDYIDNAYFIKSDNIDVGIMIYKILEDSNKHSDNTNLILTKDKYDFQLLRNNQKKNNTHLIYLKYNDNQVINKENLMNKLLHKEEVHPSFDNLFLDYLGFFYSISGLSSRSTKGIKGFGDKKAYKLIKNYWKDKGFISKCSEFVIKDMMIQNNMEKYIDFITGEYKSIDIEWGLEFLFSESDRFYLSENIYKNKYDNESIMYLNDKYYKRNPLNLIYLSEGCGVLNARNWEY